MVTAFGRQWCKDCTHAWCSLNNVSPNMNCDCQYAIPDKTSATPCIFLVPPNRFGVWYHETCFSACSSIQRISARVPCLSLQMHSKATLQQPCYSRRTSASIPNPSMTTPETRLIQRRLPTVMRMRSKLTALLKQIHHSIEPTNTPITSTPASP